MRIPVAKQGWPFIAAFAAMTAVCVRWLPWLAPVTAFLTIFSLFFFRDPERDVPSEEGVVVSPADGTVLHVKPVLEESFLQGEAVCVSIFMSVFNVHVNRAPIDGRITHHRYVPGRFDMAFKDKAAEDNERNDFGFEGQGTRLLCRQIAGWIARRIVWWVRPDDELKRGERYGLIRFGSRVDLFLDPATTIRVRKGDKVTAGTTVIGELP